MDLRIESINHPPVLYPTGLDLVLSPGASRCRPDAELPGEVTEEEELPVSDTRFLRF